MNSCISPSHSYNTEVEEGEGWEASAMQVCLSYLPELSRRSSAHLQRYFDWSQGWMQFQNLEGQTCLRRLSGIFWSRKERQGGGTEGVFDTVKLHRWSLGHRWRG